MRARQRRAGERTTVFDTNAPEANRGAPRQVRGSRGRPPHVWRLPFVTSRSVRRTTQTQVRPALAPRASRWRRRGEAVTTASTFEPALPSERQAEPPSVFGALHQPEDVLEENLRGFARGAAAEERERSGAAFF
jgi:hypothetical protein